MKENGRKGSSEETAARSLYCRREVIASLYRLRLISVLSVYEITKKKPKLKAITRTKWEEIKNCNKNNKSVK